MNIGRQRVEFSMIELKEMKTELKSAVYRH
jgi:hypothetical protein